MATDTVTFDRAADYYDRTCGFPPGQDVRIAAFIAEFRLDAFRPPTYL